MTPTWKILDQEDDDSGRFNLLNGENLREIFQEILSHCRADH